MLVFPSDTFEIFLYVNIFDKTAFCLGEKKGMLINNECAPFGIDAIE